MIFLKRHKKSILYLLLFTLIYVILVVLLPEKSHPGDMGHWERWSAFMLTEGFPNIYDYGIVYPTIFPCNYPPLLLYFLDLFGHLFGTVESISEHIKYFKAIPLLFDFIGAASIFLLIKKDSKTQFLPLLLLFNIAYLYNSIFWGQVDSIPTTFVLLSLIFAIRSQLTFSLIFYVLAINTKLQMIIFLPLLGLVLFPLFLKSYKKSTFSFGVALMTQLILILPFLVAGTIPKLFYVLTHAVDQYTNISLNAFNFWHLVMNENPMYNKDYQMWWLGLSYKKWGLLLFFTFSAVSLLPIFLKSLKRWKQKAVIDQNFKEMIFLSAFLVAICFFFFNTQMHERYSHPIIIMSFYFGVLSRQYWIYGIASLAYLLNMELVLKAFEWIKYDHFLFNQQFIASLFLIAMVLGFIQLYRRLKLF